jgi:hypothetical protein
MVTLQTRLAFLTHTQECNSIDDIRGFHQMQYYQVLCIVYLFTIQTVLQHNGSELHADGLKLFLFSRKKDEEELEHKFLLKIEISLFSRLNLHCCCAG